MAKVNVKGLHSATKTLADGSKRTYWYAWRNGPRLPGKPGEPEFLRAYHEALEAAKPKHVGTLQHVLARYQGSVEFTDLAPRTRADYVKQIRKIEAEFGAMPIAALDNRKVREDFRAWHAELAQTGRRQADYARTVLTLILTWAEDHTLVPANPAAGLGSRRGKRKTRRDLIWSKAQEDSLMAVASEPLRLALQLAIHSGQRQGDMLRLRWNAYDGKTIRLTQSKTGAHVAIPVAPALKAMLDSTPRSAVTILTTQAGLPWTESGFRASWRTACKRAGVAGVTFHDLRGTAVVRFARAGATIAQIASFTGHALKDAESILGAHYMGRDAEMAESAMWARVAHEAGTDSTN